MATFSPRAKLLPLATDESWQHGHGKRTIQYRTLRQPQSQPQPQSQSQSQTVSDIIRHAAPAQVECVRRTRGHSRVKMHHACMTQDSGSTSQGGVGPVLPPEAGQQVNNRVWSTYRSRVRLGSDGSKRRSKTSHKDMSLANLPLFSLSLLRPRREPHLYHRDQCASRISM